MSEKDDTPKFSEKAVDDLAASHGRKPSQKEMGMLDAMIETERLKIRIREELRQEHEERELKDRFGRER